MSINHIEARKVDGLWVVTSRDDPGLKFVTTVLSQSISLVLNEDLTFDEQVDLARDQVDSMPTETSGVGMGELAAEQRMRLRAKVTAEEKTSNRAAKTPRGNRAWIASEDRKLGTMPDMELAGFIGRTENAVMCRRNALRLMKFRPGQTRRRRYKTLNGRGEEAARTREAANGSPKVRAKRRNYNTRPWTQVEIDLLGTAADREVGDLIGRSGSTCHQKRTELGIPSKYLPCGAAGGRALRVPESNGKTTAKTSSLFGQEIPAPSDS
jgi:hypothetical protein